MPSDAAGIPADLPRLRKNLGAPECGRLLKRLREWLENGDALDGTITLAKATEAERDHLAALFGGAPSRSVDLRVDLRQLEECLRHGELADSLAQAVEALCGPVANRRAERVAREERWTQLFATARSGVESQADLLTWLDELRDRGILRHLAEGGADTAEALLNAAITVLARLPVTDVPLPQFAAESLGGDSHALDPDRAVTGLVLRALARRAGLDRWDDAESRRDAWAAAGVIADEVSAPVLVLNMPALPTNTAGRQLRLLAEAGEPAYLTVRQLLRAAPEFEPGDGRTIFVCENPTVVVAAASALGSACAPLVCIQGQLKTSARLLLKQLSEAGWRLAYHGDFDWPGLQIAAHVFRRLGANAWRMSAADYSSASPSSVVLTGFEVPADWDANLSQAMKDAGHAVLEEQVLDRLLADLRAPVAR